MKQKRTPICFFIVVVYCAALRYVLRRVILHRKKCSISLTLSRMRLHAVVRGHWQADVFCDMHQVEIYFRKSVGSVICTKKHTRGNAGITVLDKAVKQKLFEHSLGWIALHLMQSAIVAACRLVYTGFYVEMRIESCPKRDAKQIKNLEQYVTLNC